MNNDPYSLSRLRDILVPNAPPMWPPALGVWVLLGLVLLALLTVGWRSAMLWRRNAYRRAGLALLSKAQTAHEVSVLLKRVALVAFPREQVASLYGEEWVAFLARTCPRSDFSKLLAVEAGHVDISALSEIARIWITMHKRDEATIGGLK